MKLKIKKFFFNKVIYLRRKGTKHNPLFEILLKINKRNSCNFFIEKLGSYNPCFSKRIFFIDVSRLAYWLQRGAYLNFAVKCLIVKFLGI